MFRNRYIFDGLQIALKIRRTLCAALFDKVVQFSMKSMTETNSGKLISLISADLFIIERGLSIFTLNFAAPFISLFTCYLLFILVGIEYTLMVFIIWAVTMFL